MSTRTDSGGAGSKRTRDDVDSSRNVQARLAVAQQPEQAEQPHHAAPLAQATSQFDRLCRDMLGRIFIFCPSPLATIAAFAQLSKEANVSVARPLPYGFFWKCPTLPAGNLQSMRHDRVVGNLRITDRDELATMSRSMVGRHVSTAYVAVGFVKGAVLPQLSLFPNLRCLQLFFFETADSQADSQEVDGSETSEAESLDGRDTFVEQFNQDFDAVGGLQRLRVFRLVVPAVPWSDDCSLAALQRVGATKDMPHGQLCNLWFDDDGNIVDYSKKHLRFSDKQVEQLRALPLKSICMPGGMWGPAPGHQRALGVKPDYVLSRLLAPPSPILHQTLQNLGNPSITAAVVPALVSLHNTLTSLDLVLDMPHTDFLRELTALTELHFHALPYSYVQIDKQRVLGVIGSLTQLRKLTLEQSDTRRLWFTTDDVGQCVAKLQQLQSLAVLGTLSQDRPCSLAFLKQLPRTLTALTLDYGIERTSLRRFSQVEATPANIQHLQGLQLLRELRLIDVFHPRENHAAIVAQLTQSLPHLLSVALSR
jgi:hypothetical protein